MGLAQSSIEEDVDPSPVPPPPAIAPYAHSYPTVPPSAAVAGGGTAQPLLGARRPPPQREDGGSVMSKGTKVVRSPVNIHKKSVKVGRDPSNPDLLQFSFKFDARVAASVSFLHGATEVVDRDTSLISFTSQVATLPHHVRAGMDQEYRTTPSNGFNIANHPLLPEHSSEASAQHRSSSHHHRSSSGSRSRPASVDRAGYPIVIQLKAEQSEQRADEAGPSPSATGPVVTQVQYTYLSLKKLATGGYAAHVLGQKLRYGNHIYIMHEIYGMDRGGHEGDTIDGHECVICLTEDRNTAVLPCRHMCLCSQCADIMRMSSSQCPVCRQTATGLLRITVQNSVSPEGNNSGTADAAPTASVSDSMNLTC